MSPNLDMDELFDLDLALTRFDENESTDDKHHSDAHAVEVGELPTVIMDGGAGDCGVCMEGFGVGGSAKQVPCAHVFHENCLSRWLCIHNSCPLCRRRIISN